MTDFRVVVLSDTHLSASHPFFFHNFDVVREATEALAPDMVVITGDLAFNGPDAPEDLDVAAAQIARLGAPLVRVVPGNHDLGYSPAAADQEQSTTPARRQAYLDRFGPDFWSVDHGGWRFVGLNPFLFESGLEAEAEQRAMTAEALAHDGPVGVFTHVPFFLNRPDEDDAATTATVAPGPRADYLALFRGADVRFVASGHLHRDKRLISDGVAHIWAPSTAFMFTGRDELGGAPLVGFLELRFSGDRVSATTHEPRDLLNIDLRNWLKGDDDRYFRIAEQPFRRP
ncbi:MAG: metallophosphoesterase [Pseudomonadota bacterium]